MQLNNQDVSMVNDQSKLCTLESAVEIFNKQNPKLKIQKTDLLRCGALKFITLNFHCFENLRLVVFDEVRDAEVKIGNYAYGDAVEILDFELNSDMSHDDSIFTTHKVRPINIHLLKPMTISTPKLKGEYLNEPYYFVPNMWTIDCAEQQNGNVGYDDATQMFEEIMLKKSDLPKIKFAIENLIQNEERNVKGIREAVEVSSRQLLNTLNQNEHTIKSELKTENADVANREILPDHNSLRRIESQSQPGVAIDTSRINCPDAPLDEVKQRVGNMQHTLLAQVTRPTLSTNEAAYFLNRKPQTLRSWASTQNGPILPQRINGRLAWSVSRIKELIQTPE